MHSEIQLDHILNPHSLNPSLDQMQPKKIGKINLQMNEITHLTYNTAK